jgi:hypothetical protein
MQEGTKHALDAVSIVTVVGTLADVLPALAALFTIIWTGIRIWETPTVQGLLKRFKTVSNTDRDGNE